MREHARTVANNMSKLVRDKIPEIIPEAQRGEFRFTEMNELQYHVALRDKLLEEVEEFLADESLEELADVFEVIDAILELKGWTRTQVYTAQQDKARQRGKFAKRLLMQHFGNFE